jgi:hypothetical protein
VSTKRNLDDFGMFIIMCVASLSIALLAASFIYSAYKTSERYNSEIKFLCSEFNKRNANETTNNGQ